MKTSRQIELGHPSLGETTSTEAPPAPLGRPPEVFLEDVERGLRRARVLRSEAAWNLGEAIAAGLGALLERARRAHQERAAIRELNALDDRTLRDIGIGRDEIPLVARGLHRRSTQRRVANDAQGRSVTRAPDGTGFPAAANDECCARAA